MKILIPRNLDTREEKQIKNELCKIREYIKKGSKGSLYLNDSKLTKLPDELVQVGGSLFIDDSNISDLNNLRYIKYSLYAANPKLTKLPDDLYVGGYLRLENTLIDEIPNLLKVQKETYLSGSLLSKKYTIEQIRQIIEDKGGYVKGRIFVEK